MQVDILATMLTGLEPPAHVRVADFDDPYRMVYQAIKGVPAADRVRAMTEAMNGSPEQQAIIGTLMSNSQLSNSSVYRSLAELSKDIPPIVWLWPRWIIRGMINMLAAAPGTGKSVVALDLCRRVMTPGETWPDGQMILQHGPVIYLDAEGVPQLHNERAIDWEMNISRFYLMPDPLNGGIESVDLLAQEWRDRVIEMTHAIKPELIVIDSLGDVNSKGENNVEDVRELFQWLGRYALDFQIGVMIIHHTRKSGHSTVLDIMTQDDVRGSGHITAKARSILGLSNIKNSENDDDSSWRRLEILKANIGRKPTPLGIEFLPGLRDTPTLRYGAAPERPRETSEGDICQQWMLDLLAGGPMRPFEIIEEGKAEGYSRALIYKVRALLGKKIHNTSGARSPDNMWELSRI